MPTIQRFINTASTAGGNGTTNGTTGATRAYASMSEWESNEQTNLDTANNIHDVQCSGSAADTTAVVINGWITSATDYILIRGHASDVNGAHVGAQSTSRYRLTPTITNIPAIDPQDLHIRFEDFQIAPITNGQVATYCIWTNSSPSGFSYYAQRMIMWGDPGGNTFTTERGIATLFSTGDFRIGNCVFQDFNGDTEGDAFFDVGNAGSNNWLHNNTFYNCNFGMRDSGSSTNIAINNIMALCNTNADGTWAAGTDYNLTDDASIGYTVTGGGNTHDQTSATAVFTDTTNDDFSLASGDTAIDNGVDLSADANFPFSDDNIQVTRSGTWDIGAFDFAAGGATPVLGHNLLLGVG